MPCAMAGMARTPTTMWKPSRPNSPAITDRKYALMTPNCTTALYLLLAGLGIGEGDEVIAPECTWIGSVACITYQRATTCFCRCRPSALASHARDY